MADVEKIIINEQSYPVKDVNAVSVLEQFLTAEQKAQVQANIGVTAATNVYTKSETDTLLNGKISTTAKGTSNGVAELDSNGKVPSSQLPSFVDDVVEGYYKTDNDRFYEESTFTILIEPVAGKSWVDIPTNKSYRWTGSVYVRVDEGVQIGETSDTAYAGNKGKANADAIAAIKDGTSIDSFGDVEIALADKISKSQTVGLVKNDGTIDTTNYVSDISGKADKVSGATNGNFAGLDANGNLVDSGKKASDFAQIQSDWAQYNSSEMDFIKNKPPIQNGHGTGGNLEGGTSAYATYSNSVAYGNGANAIADYAVAIGQSLNAAHAHEIAFGKYNVSNADTAFSIGDGTGTGATPNHNLMELKTDGTLLLNGNAVKTEDAADNKLRLGQICGMKFSSSTIGRHVFSEGFGYLFGTINSITFTSDTSAAVVASTTVYQFGDFVGYVDDSNTVIVRPIQGKLDYPTTGQWIKIENCYNMFMNCVVITSLDLSSFDTSEVENMQGMFYRCTALTNLDISSFDMTNVVAYDKMFGEANYWAGITTLKCPKINPHDDIPLPRTLYSQDGTAYTNLPVTTGTSIELRVIFITE